MRCLRPALIPLLCLLAVSVHADDLPSLGDSSSGIISQRQEHELGHAWLSIIRAQSQQIPDPLLKDYVETSVYRLAETSQLQDRRLSFILLKNPQLNAFAAPGGIIGVNGGLFLYAKTEGEYASVLSHELAHLSQRHFARGIQAQQNMQMPTLAGMLAGIVAIAAGAGDAGMAALAGSQAAAMKAQQSFSRQNEQEADRIGLVNLEQAGYDPRSMPTMFERMQSQFRYDSKPPEFLLTHPLSESRIADTRNRAEQYPPGGKIDSLRYQLIRARMQLVFEQTPGLAIKSFKAILDENPKIDAARYGLAIAQADAEQYQQARETLQPLLQKAPNEIIYNLARIEIDIKQDRLEEAQQKINQMLRLYPAYYPLQQALVDLQTKQNKPALAEQTLDELLKTRPFDPDIWYQVAEVRGQTANIVGLHQARAEFFALNGDYPQAIQQLEFAKSRAGKNFPLSAKIDARQQQLMEEQQMLEQMMR